MVTSAAVTPPASSAAVHHSASRENTRQHPRPLTTSAHGHRQRRQGAAPQARGQRVTGDRDAAQQAVGQMPGDGARRDPSRGRGDGRAQMAPCREWLRTAMAVTTAAAAIPINVERAGRGGSSRTAKPSAATGP